MTSKLLRDVTAGSVAGLVSGLAFGWAIDRLPIPGVTGDPFSFVLHVVALACLGAIFGATFRYQPDGFAASTSTGLLFGLLWWIVGPLTLAPLLRGEALTWSVEAARALYPSLAGSALYGLCTG